VTLAQPVEALGEALEAGIALIAGVVPTDGSAGLAGPSDPGRTVAPMRALWNRIGLPAESLADLAVSPTCGLSGLSPDAARAALAAARLAARRLVEDPEGADGR
jgi:hypothetical protein